jgi:hypothetical protein
MFKFRVLTVVAVVAAALAGTAARPALADDGGLARFHVTASFATTPIGPVPPCGAAQLRILGVGTVRGTQLGNGVWQQDECVDFAVMPGFAVVDGRLTLVSVSGDMLSIHYAVSTLLPDAAGNYHPAGTFTITGGTGRFADTTGFGTIRADENVFTLTGTATLDGVISFARDG